MQMHISLVGKKNMNTSLGRLNCENASEKLNITSISEQKNWFIGNGMFQTEKNLWKLLNKISWPKLLGILWKSMHTKISCLCRARACLCVFWHKEKIWFSKWIVQIVQNERVIMSFKLTLGALVVFISRRQFRFVSPPSFSVFKWAQSLS